MMTGALVLWHEDRENNSTGEHLYSKRLMCAILLAFVSVVGARRVLTSAVVVVPTVIAGGWLSRLLPLPNVVITRRRLVAKNMVQSGVMGM